MRLMVPTLDRRSYKTFPASQKFLENYRVRTKQASMFIGSDSPSQMKKLSPRDAEWLDQGHTAFPSLNGHESLSISFLSRLCHVCS